MYQKTLSAAAAGLLFLAPPTDIPAVYKRVVPSVVSIEAMGTKRNPVNVNGPRVPYKLGIGTGFIVKTPEPIIFTNYHVVEDAEIIYLGKDHTSVEILYADPFNDIAILDASELSSDVDGLAFCSTKAEIGDTVMAIGSPFGLEGSLSVGVVSGLDRTISEDHPNDLIQTDAEINPGNSGGPLLDARSGCVLGMNTAIMSPSGASAGVGFAIPASTLQTAKIELTSTT